MKLNLKFSFLLTALLTIICFCNELESRAANVKIYVSVNGKDGNSGTRDRPLASLKEAVSKLRTLRNAQHLNGPIEVIVGDGEYLMTEPLELFPEDSGTDDAPVIFKADEGAHPVFSGGKRISGFEKISETLWKAKVPEVTVYDWYFEQLYVNGNRAVRAKSPNTGFYHLKNTADTILHKGSAEVPELAVQQFSLYADGASQLAQYSRNDFENSVITFYHNWDNTRNRIFSFDSQTSSAFVVGTAAKSYNRIDSKSRYTIENFKAALDTCGEWFLDRSGYLYYMPLPGESIDKLEVIAPVADHLLAIKGNERTGKKVENIRFQGLSFRFSGYKMPYAGNEQSQAAFPVDAVIMADFVKRIQFVNCEVSHVGTNAFWFRSACDDCKVEHCYIHDLGAGGVKIGDLAQPKNLENLTRNIVVDNNIIRSGGFVFPCAVGVISFNASDNQITHNEIADFRYSGVSVGWVWGYSYSPSKRNKIAFNHIHHLGWAELCDMGGVYCLGGSEGTTVSNNRIHDVQSYDYGGWGMYADEGSTGIVFENNLVYNCKIAGFHQHYGKENIIRNNIFANNTIYQLQASRVEDHLSFTFSNNIVCYKSGKLISDTWGMMRIQSDKNCYWDLRTKDVRFAKVSFAEWQRSGKDIHSVIADPGFVNPSQVDFTIRNKAIVRKIGFKAFDYSQAGVYGSEEWKKQATLNPEIVRQFDKAVIRNTYREK
ncbi:MAG: right-handed parallel beta-helix repeat-containing protein [Mangrovibacterium sp.]